MNTTKFKLELGIIPESIPELTPLAIESDPKSIPDLELKLGPDSESKESKTEQETKPESEDKIGPESEDKIGPESEDKMEPKSESNKTPKTDPESQQNPDIKLEPELNSIIKTDSVLDVNESIKTLTQYINYHDYDDSLPHFIEHDKPKIKKIMFNFEPIIPNEPIKLQKKIPQLDSDDSYCTCILSKNSD
jgi:hypothetical protein